jgi:hypothetical protein
MIANVSAVTDTQSRCCKAPPIQLALGSRGVNLQNLSTPKFYTNSIVLC